MKIWRMAFRIGPRGYDLWPKCLELGIAAIEYPAMIGVDLSRCQKNEPRYKWRQLASSQVYSLRQVAYAMQRGDLIFVKSGPLIVGKGRILGPYQFDKRGLLTDPNGRPWEHQVPVEWHQVGPVKIQLGTNQLFTVQELAEQDVRSFDEAFADQFVH